MGAPRGCVSTATRVYPVMMPLGSVGGVQRYQRDLMDTITVKLLGGSPGAAERITKTK